MDILALGAIGIVYLLILVVVVITSIFWIVEIVDIARREFRDPMMKFVWLAIVFFSHIIGALVYFFIGKKDGVLPGQSQYGQ